jgi:hypothetical protein
MGAFSFVELERTSQRIEDTLGDPAQIAPFEAGVVLDADAGKQGHLVPAEPGNAPVCPVEWQARLLGVSLARLEARKSRASLRLSMPTSVGPGPRPWEALPVPVLGEPS